MIDVDTSDGVEGSFYHGEVTVLLKDAIFERSTSVRTVLELEQYLLKWYGSVKDRTLVVFTDGGNEHRVNLDSVKIPLIAMFERLELGHLVALRTAPNNSWTNYVERVMATLNLALQNLALARMLLEHLIEEEIKKCESWEDFRKNEDTLREPWQRSIEPVRKLIAKRFRDLEYTNSPVMTQRPATEMEIEDLQKRIVGIFACIDSTKMTKADVAKADEYQTYLKEKCWEGKYVFQIRRNETFGWMPTPKPDSTRPGHYLKYNECKDQAPCDTHLPSNTIESPAAVAEAVQGIKNSKLVGQNARAVIRCRQCKKPRVLYALKHLSKGQKVPLKRLIANVSNLFECGSL